MARRSNARQRSNQRRNEARARAVALPPGIERQPRVPLVGFEAHYEITRSGHVYSRRRRRFIQHAWFEGRPYIKFQVDGREVTLNIDDAVARTWPQVRGRLVAVEIPASTFVVLVRDEREGLEVALAALQEEVRDGRVPHVALPIESAADVPGGWLDSRPYPAAELEQRVAERELEYGEQTVQDYLRTPDVGACNTR